MSVSYIYIIAGAILGLVLLFLRVFAKHTFFRSNKFVLHIILFLGCISLLGYHFYERKITEGYIAIALGSIAFGKYIYDVKKK
jgi:hypothetical protein